MADLENEAPDLDTMDDKGRGELMDRMRSGEDVSKPVEKPAKEAAADDPAADAEIEDDTAVSDDPAADKPAKTKQETVSFGQFDRERNRRKEAETRFEKLQADNSRIMEQFTALMARQEQPKSPVNEAPALPDPNADPLGGINYLMKEVQAIRSETAAEKQQREQTQQRQTQVEQAMSFAREEFGAAAKTDPTVQKAYSALLESFALEQHAYGVPDAQINAKLAEIEQQHIFYAQQQKIPLGEYVKNLAKARGWNANAAAPLTIEATANPDPAPDTTVQQVQRSASSLSGTGGAPARTGLPSPQALLDMSPQQYAKYREAHSIGEAFGWRG